MQLDGALADLLALVHTHGTVHPDIAKRVMVSPAATLPEYESTWPFKLSDLVDPRQAAVLLLFGALDDRPATFQRTIVPQELDVLLTQRSMALRNHPGQVSFPGGGVEPQDDDEVDCAIRETYEETGIDPTGIIPLGKLPELPLPVSNFRVTPVVGWWQHPNDDRHRRSHPRLSRSSRRSGRPEASRHRGRHGSFRQPTLRHTGFHRRRHPRVGLHRNDS